MGNTRHYSNEEVANIKALLEANGGNAKLTSKLTGVPRSTIRQWANRNEHTQPSRQVLSDEVLAQKYERVAHKALDHAMLDKTIESAGLKEAVQAAQFATITRNLLTGKATSRSQELRITFVGGHKSLKELSQAVLKGDIPVLPELGDGQIRDIGRESPQE